MATVSFSEYYDESRQKKSTASTKDFKVGYFNSLKNNGDEAIVRFAYGDSSEFEFTTVHRVQVGEKKFRSVACLRKSFIEEKDNCPLCASGNKFSTKFYVKVVEYTKDEAGNVVANAKVWERPAGFNQNILSAVNAAIESGLYPATSKIGDIVFKVTRVLPRNETDVKKTTYNIVPMNTAVYKPDIYVKDFSAFQGLDLAHHSYWEKTAEEMTEFITTGKFPFPVREKSSTEQSVQETKLVSGLTDMTFDSTITSPVVEPSAQEVPSTPRRYTF